MQHHRLSSGAAYSGVLVFKRLPHARMRTRRPRVCSTLLQSSTWRRPLASTASPPSSPSRCSLA